MTGYGGNARDLEGSSVSGVRKSLARVEVALKWDPSAPGSPANDLDIIAAVYAEGDVRGTPEYVVYFDHRAPDGTITLNRDSRTGQGSASTR